MIDDRDLCWALSAINVKIIIAYQFLGAIFIKCLAAASNVNCVGLRNRYA